MKHRPSDETLMLRFQDDGDYEAFEELFRRHKHALLSFLWRLSADETQAEEVSQAAWLKLIEQARDRRYRPSSRASFRTYLFTLGRNHYIDEYVRKHEVTRTESLEARGIDPPGSVERDPADDALAAQLAGHVDQALKALPFEQREVIAMWVAEMSIEDMAKIIGAPRDTVLSRKKYSLKKLRRFFEQMGIFEAS